MSVPLDTPEVGVLLDALREGRGDEALLERFAVSWAEELGVDEYGLWARVLGHRLRRLRPGRYLRGSPPEEEGRFDNEVQHEVELTRGFWIGETAVTQALWLEVMGGENPSRFQGPDHPVETVSWDDAQSFCVALNERFVGLGARLPTEAEWEYACRAGTTTATYFPVLDEIAWYLDNTNSSPIDGDRGTRRVGQKRANPWGLFDMLGNVYEWCEDAADGWPTAPYASAQDVDLLNTAGPVRVFRGGSWSVHARSARAAYRNALGPGSRNGHVGFRVAGGGAPSRRSRRRAGRPIVVRRTLVDRREAVGFVTPHLSWRARQTWSSARFVSTKTNTTATWFWTRQSELSLRKRQVDEGA